MLLDGRELAGFIKERQAKQVRVLRAKKTFPKLAVVLVGENKASEKYIIVKAKYAEDIGIELIVVRPSESKLNLAIEELNKDSLIHGIIIQLPLPKTLDSDSVVTLIKPTKDVDGLGSGSVFPAATPTAILWLLSGYNIDLKNNKIAAVGLGRLVGKPLVSLLSKSNILVSGFDEQTKDLAKQLPNFDIIITAVGKPGLIKTSMVKPGAVVIDAGTAEAKSKLAGDVDPDLYKRDDIKVSPVPGGVGPLTVAALFENVIGAASSEQ